jgi:type II secretory pathway component PulF
MQFKYLAYTSSGEVTAGKIEAGSAERAEEILAERDLTVVSLKKEWKIPSPAEALPTIFGVKRKDLVPFTRNLARLLASGISLFTALKTLRDQTHKMAFKTVLRQVVVAVETGSSFSQALSQHPSVFPPVYLRLVQIGEEIGNLELMLEQIAEHLEREMTIATKIRRALAYPSFVLLLAMVAVFIVITMVLPNMAGLLQEFGGELPLTTRVVMGVSTFLRQYIHFFIGGVAVVAFVLWRYLKTPGGMRRKDLAMVTIPVVKGVSLNGSLSWVARSFSILLKAGVPLTEALELVIQTSQNLIVREALNGVRAGVLRGQALAQAMASQGVFPTLFTEMVRIGEETGSMTENLENLAEFYEQQMSSDISRLTGMLEPALVIFVGGIVGFIAVSIMTPMYSAIQQIR